MLRILICLFIAVPAFATSLRVNGACTPQEKWELPAVTPAWMRAVLEGHAGTSAQAWPEAFAGSAAHSPLGAYARGRLLTERGLIEEAIDAYLEAAQKSGAKGLSPARDAAVECVAELHDKFLFMPTTVRERELVSTIAPSSLGSHARHAHARLLARHLLKALLQGESHGPTQERALAILEAAGFRRLVAAFHEASGAWPAAGEHLAIALDRIRPALVEESVPAFLRLANARQLAQSGKNEEAIALYDQVPGGTPWSLAARGEKAALQVQAKDINGTLGTAFELRDSTGEWTPDAYESLVRAVLSACAYPEVLKGVSRFKKAYLTTWQWVQRHGSAPLYRELVGFMHGKGSMPRAVAEVLATSPEFLSLQQQLNLTIDARDKMPSLGTTSGVASSVRYQWIQRLNDLRRRNADREHALLVQLDHRLGEQAQRYFGRLREVRDQIELMEIEANSHVGQEADVAQAIARGEREPGPQWHWGTAVLFAEGGPGERWADETGKVRGNLKTYCANN